MSSITVDPAEVAAFNRLAFPNRMRADTVEVRAVGDPAHSQVVVRATIVDQHGHETLRVDPGEIIGPVFTAATHEVDRNEFVFEPLEVERDADTVGGRRPPVAI